jgi:Domain of unknown function (DUF4115)
MQGENRSRVPFDDRAALEELERLQRSIQEYRRRREVAEGDFEKFVGSFRTPTAEPAAAGAAPGSRVPPPAGKPATVSPLPPPRPRGLDIFKIAEQPQAGPGSPSAPGVSAPVPVAAAPVVVAPPPAPVRGVPSPAPPPILLPGAFLSSGPVVSGDAVVATGERPRTRRAMRGVIPLALGGAAILLLAAVLITRSRNTPADPSAAPAPATVETPAAAPVPVPAATPPPATVVAPAEVRAVRAVWVRVLVDGNKAVERELEANAVVPLPAGRTYVVRAGDAGAVRLLLNGQDQGPVGRDGIVATRTFSAPAR